VEVAQAQGHAERELHFVGGGEPIGMLSYVVAQASMLSQLREEKPIPPVLMFAHDHTHTWAYICTLIEGL
jgi:hypothetical protein